MSILSNLNKAQLSAALGYEFNDQSLLVRALSHRSVGKENNERMEFLGDSLLNFFIAESLFNRFPHAREGDLTRLRATLVKGETLAEIARDFKLGEFLFLGEGEMKSGGFRRASILADTVEALLGAIYLESGMEVCRDIVLSWYATRLEQVSPEQTEKDAKTRLQEYLQERKKPLPQYRVLRCLGDSHSPEFEICCEVGRGLDSTKAIASSKRQAEKLAAQKMLQILGLS
ncbi:ribonuclease III [Teredinibacter franksiae]|uniref:ribonuclease III n=1 Tax=Teredinibacter franksiae TaxID=2761453 RepID=UPI0028B09A84|nr:ribonuclease III [Teredinibacter franksiae]